MTLSICYMETSKYGELIVAESLNHYVVNTDKEGWLFEDINLIDRGKAI